MIPFYQLEIHPIFANEIKVGGLNKPQRRFR